MQPIDEVCDSHSHSEAIVLYVIRGRPREMKGLLNRVTGEPKRRASRIALSEMREGCHSMFECNVHGDE